MSFKLINKFTLIILAAIILLNSCSNELSYRILNFVFDGVPEYNKKKEIAKIDSINTDTLNVAILPKERSKSNVFIHEPYKERNCVGCHDPNNLTGSDQTQIELCYQCHENLSNSQKALHGPVDAGFCTECHNPHMANNSKLLKFEGDSLCLQCHDKFNNDIHKGIDENCINCHHPHGGENNFILQTGACIKCHKNFTDRYAFVHGPVSGEFCQECHSSHTNSDKNLLIRNGQALCLYCHDIKRVLKNDVHDDIGDVSCTECHNPHGGEDNSMLY